MKTSTVTTRVIAVDPSSAAARGSASALRRPPYSTTPESGRHEEQRKMGQEGRSRPAPRALDATRGIVTRPRPPDRQSNDQQDKSQHRAGHGQGRGSATRPSPASWQTQQDHETHHHGSALRHMRVYRCTPDLASATRARPPPRSPHMPMTRGLPGSAKRCRIPAGSSRATAAHPSSGAPEQERPDPPGRTPWVRRPRHRA